MIAPQKRNRESCESLGGIFSKGESKLNAAAQSFINCPSG
jgi:hypothetical protein